MNKFFKALLKGFVIWVVSVITVIILISYFMEVGNSGELLESEIVVLHIKGTIGSADEMMGVRSISAEGTLAKIYKLRKSKKLKVLILRVNSGGGTLPGTQEIYLELKKLKDTIPDLKIVSSVSEVAASGAYYIITLSDVIYANPGAMVGNIGVISMFPNARELMKKLGVEFEIVKKGKYKDLGAWWKKMQDYEKKNMNEMAHQAMEMFIDVVIRGRKDKISRLKSFSDEKKTEEYIRSLCNGEIFLGAKAKENGLIDEIGNFYDAYDWAKECVGKDEPVVYVIRKKGSLLNKLMGVSGFFRKTGLLSPAGKVML